LRDKLTGKEMDLQVLPKLVHMAKKERRERLAAPSSQGATHGQGVYVREFVRGSAKCMGVMVRRLKNTVLRHSQKLLILSSSVCPATFTF